MASNVNGLPCGFCGSMVFSYHCQGCGCRFLERNFSFGTVYDRLSEIREDVERACAGGGSFDADDSQVHGILSMEPGWFLGIRTYDIRAKSSGLNVDDPKYRALAEAPSSPPEATPADFYDARHLCGRWKNAHRDFSPRDFEGTVELLRRAGFLILPEVLEYEKEFGDYDWSKRKSGESA